MKNKLKRAWQWLAGNLQLFFLNLWGWIRNVFFTFIWFKSINRIFYGWMHYKLAVIYANKRTKVSAVNKYCGGKIHYVLPFGEFGLIVVNRLEIKHFQDRGIFQKFNIDGLLKNAYYVSNNKPKRKLK